VDVGVVNYIIMCHEHFSFPLSLESYFNKILCWHFVLYLLPDSKTGPSLMMMIKVHFLAVLNLTVLTVLVSVSADQIIYLASFLVRKIKE